MSQNIVRSGLPIMMNVRLEIGEEVLYQTERAVLTNRRLMASLDMKSRNQPTDEADLRDISGFQKLSGGQESRMKQGVIGLMFGLVLTLIQVALGDTMSYAVGGVLFMVSALALLIGIYLVLSSYMRIQPNTTVVFNVVGSRDIPVRFPGKDSPLADEMTRLFARTKRGLR